MNPHPDPHRRAGRPGRGRERALPCDGGCDGVLSTGEGDEKRVALCVDRVALVRREHLPENPIVLVEHLAVAGAQPAHEAGRVLDVRET